MHPGGSQGAVPARANAIALRGSHRFEVGTRTEGAALPVQNGYSSPGVGIEASECVGERPGGREVDRVSPLRARQQYGGHWACALHTNGLVHLRAPMARSEKAPSESSNSAAEAPSSRRDRGPTRASPQAPTSAAALSARSWSGSSPAATAAPRHSAISSA